MAGSTGTKQIRIGRVLRLVQELNRKKKFLIQLREETTIPAKKAYYDGKIDTLVDVINEIEKDFGIGAEGGE